MKKNKIISIILKVISVFVLLYGSYHFCYWKLWEEQIADLFVELQIILPVLILGMSGCLYGIATLLDTTE